VLVSTTPLPAVTLLPFTSGSVSRLAALENNV